MKLTWQQIEFALVAAHGEDGEEAVLALRRMEGLLNQFNQCGDVRRLYGPVDGGLYAMDQGEVATRD